MRLSNQVLWLVSISILFRVAFSYAIQETTPGEAADEVGEESYEEEDGDDGPDVTEPPLEFDDFVDLDALAKGVLGRGDRKDSVVPCFGTWWPSTGGYGGYVYYYDDYGTDYGGGDGTTDYGTGDYGGRKRNRNRRRRRRTRRNRSRRSRRARKAAKKKS